MALHTIELCTGVGMLGEGLRAGLAHLGIETRTVCYVEREAYPAAVLVARQQEGSLDAAPVWSDMLTFNGRRFRGHVDGIVAGFPCQDLSVAGKRAGLDGARSGLFFRVVDIADDCGAWFLFLENVTGITTASASAVDEAEGALEERAAARVLGELADRGWHAEWVPLSASDVGANHGRARWFCLAWRMAYPGLQQQHLQQRPHGAEHPAGSKGLGNANGQSQQCTRLQDEPEPRQRPRSGTGGPDVGMGGDLLVNTQGLGCREGRAEHGRVEGGHSTARDGGALVNARHGPRTQQSQCLAQCGRAADDCPGRCAMANAPCIHEQQRFGVCAAPIARPQSRAERYGHELADAHHQEPQGGGEWQ